mmetsp:Transcript_65545/g.108672  ORF Transcript_65545/g.108672 Transcript_65545/m.108672 type:complete len:330 (-) Transcript_65545:41-1030(-)
MPGLQSPCLLCCRVSRDPPSQTFMGSTLPSSPGAIMQSTLPNSRGIECVLHSWEPTFPAKGVCVIYHGYATHAKFPSVRYLAELLVADGFICMCLDFAGHGESPGTPGLIYSPADLKDDGLIVARHAQSIHPNLPLFLVGSSMGGAIALNVSRHWESECRISGLVLLAPLVKVSKVPSMTVLRAISWLAPSAALLPVKDSLSPENQYRDPERRAECVSDTLYYSGNMRLATAYSFLATALDLHENLEKIDCPFVCLFGTEDKVNEIAGADDLLERSATAASDKEVKKYEGGLHALMCEPLPIRGEIERDILAFLHKRLAADSKFAGNRG